MFQINFPICWDRDGCPTHEPLFRSAGRDGPRDPSRERSFKALEANHEAVPYVFAPWMGLVVGLSGCQHPSVTAISLNPHYCDHKFAFLYDPCKEPEGIPFYLPKPLLIVSKNFRNIEETKVGLTDSAPIPNFFDDQAKYADLKPARISPGWMGMRRAAPGPKLLGIRNSPQVMPRTSPRSRRAGLLWNRSTDFTGGCSVRRAETRGVLHVPHHIRAGPDPEVRPENQGRRRRDSCGDEPGQRLAIHRPGPLLHEG